MPEQETLNMLALASAGHFNTSAITRLCRLMGSATAVMEARSDVRDIMPGCPQALVRALADVDEARRKAAAEMEYCVRTGIEVLCLGGTGYPRRLGECTDAPPVLFYKGTADLDRRCVVNIVGTRHCTAYGRDMVSRFVSGLKELCPDVLVVSGLAYGIDICAHREALDARLDTVAVLAHGLDYIYPPRHKETALRMLEQGGLLTEHFTRTNADKLNFLRRNRIVAGMSDATVLVESASHGGGLVTARLAGEYNRDVFAFPGRAGDEYSEGCNNLIRDGKATLVGSAADFVNAIGWQAGARMRKAREQGIERTLFPELTPDEQVVADALGKGDDMHVNMLSSATAMPIGRLTPVLFSLEMKGVVRCLAGGVYHLIR